MPTLNPDLRDSLGLAGTATGRMSRDVKVTVIGETQITVVVPVNTELGASAFPDCLHYTAVPHQSPRYLASQHPRDFVAPST